MGTRERLLEAAIDCLYTEGYAGTTTRAIVARADAHLPAVNYFFGSKERLLREAVTEALRRWADTTMSVVAEPSEGSPGEQLHRSIERFLATLPQDRSYIVAAVEAFAQAERSDELRATLADAYTAFRAQVASSLTSATAVAETDNLAAEARSAASVLVALFDGLALQWLLDPEATLDATAVIHALDLIGKAIDGADIPRRVGTGPRPRRGR